MIDPLTVYLTPFARIKPRGPKRLLRQLDDVYVFGASQYRRSAYLIVNVVSRVIADIDDLDHTPSRKFHMSAACCSQLGSLVRTFGPRAPHSSHSAKPYIPRPNRRTPECVMPTRSAFELQNGQRSRCPCVIFCPR